MLYFTDDHITLHHGDSLEVMRGLESGSVDCVMTSPPYYALRDYGSDGQYGLEETAELYVETMRKLFNETRRVLADDGTFWLNLGDSYGDKKNLQGIPWKVAFALQDDGWILRNGIIWHKTNAMPESVTDRFSTRYEMLFLFSKRQRYWFDLDPLREKLLHPDAADGSRIFGGINKAPLLDVGSAERRTGNAYVKKKPSRGTTPWTANANNLPGVSPQQVNFDNHPDGKNPGDVWTISHESYSGAHFAVFPQELVRRCILAGCKPEGTVLDPFSGSGTTGLVANRHGRKYVGIDISKDYLHLSLTTRLQQQMLDFGELP